MEFCISSLNFLFENTYCASHRNKIQDNVRKMQQKLFIKCSGKWTMILHFIRYWSTFSMLKLWLFIHKLLIYYVSYVFLPLIPKMDRAISSSHFLFLNFLYYLSQRGAAAFLQVRREAS